MVRTINDTISVGVQTNVSRAIFVGAVTLLVIGKALRLTGLPHTRKTAHLTLRTTIISINIADWSLRRLVCGLFRWRKSHFIGADHLTNFHILNEVIIRILFFKELQKVTIVKNIIDSVLNIGKQFIVEIPRFEPNHIKAIRKLCDQDSIVTRDLVDQIAPRIVRSMGTVLPIAGIWRCQVVNMALWRLFHDLFRQDHRYLHFKVFVQGLDEFVGNLSTISISVQAFEVNWHINKSIYVQFSIAYFVSLNPLDSFCTRKEALLQCISIAATIRRVDNVEEVLVSKGSFCVGSLIQIIVRKVFRASDLQLVDFVINTLNKSIFIGVALTRCRQLINIVPIRVLPLAKFKFWLAHLFDFAAPVQKVLFNLLNPYLLELIRKVVQRGH
mmetsp:Transcript_15846/g.33499  ORF Transcript_15846/g.33499 Transcript_15846/m.33499 type:complete len:385 (-) Transcript_15846:554-1708(-)